MKVLQWCRANAMPVIAVLAAAVTAVFVPPDAAYLGYYDVKTLSCLLCVLAVVGALRRVGLFPLLAQRLAQVFHTTRGAVTALVGITLVGSMLLTNDTALLTFLPLSWFVLERTGQTKWTALTFILQNCAANLGGMLTPFGNPQNLYLFNHYNIPNGEFLSIMLPPFLLSTALILLCCLFLPREGLTVPRQETLPDKRHTAVYGVLFCVAVAMVLRGIPYWLGLLVIVMALLVLDRRALLGVDWGLLVTFAAFFTFSGNMARMEPVRTLFRQLLTHGAMPVAALTSQVISNVPCSHPAEPVHRRLSRTAGGREYRRRGDAGGVTGQPDHFPGIHKARQGADGAVPGTVLRRQLRLFGHAAGSHDVFDAIDRAPGLHGGKEADGSCSAICKSALTP
ncbi:MAG: SLC13 family permease [Lachnospiraceae bacterium]